MATSSAKFVQYFQFTILNLFQQCIRLPTNTHLVSFYAFMWSFQNFVDILILSHLRSLMYYTMRYLPDICIKKFMSFAITFFIFTTVFQRANKLSIMIFNFINICVVFETIFAYKHYRNRAMFSSTIITVIITFKNKVYDSMLSNCLCMMWCKFPQHVNLAPLLKTDRSFMCCFLSSLIHISLTNTTTATTANVPLCILIHPLFFI